MERDKDRKREERDKGSKMRSRGSWGIIEHRRLRSRVSWGIIEHRRLEQQSDIVIECHAAILLLPS